MRTRPCPTRSCHPSLSSHSATGAHHWLCAESYTNKTVDYRGNNYNISKQVISAHHNITFNIPKVADFFWIKLVIGSTIALGNCHPFGSIVKHCSTIYALTLWKRNTLYETCLLETQGKVHRSKDLMLFPYLGSQRKWRLWGTAALMSLSF